VVATDVGGVREMAPEGEVGYVVPAGDATTLAARIATLLADPEAARRMGQAGRRLAERAYQRDVIGQQYAALLANLAEDNQKRALRI
jgi:phosphatidylinositol alpha-1,6-mannosyltransferase